MRDVRVDVPPDAKFVCLVGENGTGKSTVLELLTWSAHVLGLASQAPLKRPGPTVTGRDYDVRITVDLTGRDDLVAAVAGLESGRFVDALASWDRTLTAEARGWAGATPPPMPPGVNSGSNPDGGYWYRLVAGGIAEEALSTELAGQLSGTLRSLPELLHLYIDAERVFPPGEVQDQEILQLARQDMTLPDWIKGQAAQLTQNLYLEWMRSMLGRQQRLQGEYYQEALAAANDGRSIAAPGDLLAGYRQGLAEVLPHLQFVRLDQERRRLIFDSAGEELTYEELSGGERELAFLVGQIDRFGVRDGLFLLDEPELHLNAELLRGWLDYLRGTVRNGQAWVATHSLEAAEVAGPEATLVLERDDDRLVRRCVRLADRPALATLAAALGTPAFSVARSRFILIEGTRESRERERYAAVLATTSADRFIEADSSTEVMAQAAALRLLASQEEQLRVAAIVDGDFRDDAERQRLLADEGVFVLPVLEIENFFLQPNLLERLLADANKPPDALRLLQGRSDPFAAKWAFELAKTRHGWSDGLGTAPKLGSELGWDAVEEDTAAAAASIASGFELIADIDRARRRVALKDALEEYVTVRQDLEAIWKRCFGKQVLRGISADLGFRDASFLESRAAVLWRSGEVERTRESEDLRKYLDSVPVLG